MNFTDITYHFAKGNTPVGPVSFHELKQLNLADNTLVWYEGLSKWYLLHDLPELKAALLEHQIPPPLPNYPESHTKDSHNAQASNKGDYQRKFKLSNVTKNFITIWVFVHLIALVTSYGEIKFFNDRTPETNKFWPIVEFVSCGHAYDNISSFDLQRGGSLNNDCRFHGIFKNYDWSEFAVYMLTAIAIAFIDYSKNNSQK